MKRTALLLTLALPMLAQDIAPRSTTERPNVSAPGMDQTLTGILMDASCKVISDGRSDLTQMPPAGTPTRPEGQTGAASQSKAKQDQIASTQTEKEQQAMKVYTPGGRTGAPADRQGAASTTGPDRASATGTTGAAVNTPPPAGAQTEADRRVPQENAANPQLPRLTELGRNRDTAGPSQASATGTTGAATETAPVASTGEGQRARSIEPDTSVREKYQDCMVKPTTTSFALHADGKLYVLDRASNGMIQEQMRNEAFTASMNDNKDNSKWMTVTVQGTPTSDNILTIRSVRK